MARRLQAATLVAAVLVTATASAADPTPKECLGANDTAISLRSAHKLRAAREKLLVCAAPSCPADIRNECTRRVADVIAAIPTIVFEAKDASGKDVSAVTVSMDGERLADQLDGTALAIDPGVRTFAFETAGQPKIEKQLVIREGQKGRHEPVSFGGAAAVASAAVLPAAAPPAAAPPAAPAPEPKRAEVEPVGPGKTQRAVAIGAGVIGIAGLAVSTYFGLHAASLWSDAKSRCQSYPEHCGADATNMSKDAVGAGHLSTAFLVIGGVGVVSAAVLWFTAPRTLMASTVGVGVSPSGVVVRGAF
jgi:hypothetical protein